MKKLLLCILLLAIHFFSSSAQSPSVQDQAAMVAHWRTDHADYPKEFDPFDYHALDFDGDGEDEWVAVYSGWGLNHCYFFDTDPVRPIPYQRHPPISRPGVDILVEIMDVNLDGREEALIWYGGGGTFSHNHVAEMAGLQEDSLYTMWIAGVSSVGRDDGRDDLNVVEFKKDAEGKVKAIELLPGKAALGDSAYNRHPEKAGEYLRGEWEWVDSSRSFHQRITTLWLDSLREGKYLKYETMDVRFFIPYTAELKELLRRPGMHKLYPDGGHSLWEGFHLPQYMYEWTEVAEKFRMVDHIEVTNYREFSRVIYVLLGDLLKEGAVVAFDKKSNAYLTDVRLHEYPEYYKCECYDGSVVSGYIWQTAFYAHTPNTAYLYFHTHQDRMSHDCCMEEWPYHEH